MRSWTPRRVVLGTIVVAAVVLGFWLFYRVRWVVLLFFAAIVLATALRPAVEGLRRLRLGRIPAAAAVHFAALGLVAGLSYVVAPVAVQQTASMLEALPEQYGAIRSTLVKSPNELIGLLGRGLPEELIAWLNAEHPSQPLAGLAVAWGVVVPLLGAMLAVVAVFLLSFYWTLEGGRTLRRVAILLPTERRETARQVTEEIHAKLGAFVRGQTILCVAVGSMALAAYWWIGLPYAVVLALIAGVLEAIPILGPILATIPAALVGLSLGWQTALWVVAANVVIAHVESYVLVPRVMDRSVGVHPVVTLLSITSLFALLGPVGGVLAIPVAAIVQLLVRRFVLKDGEAGQRVKDGRRGRASVLLYRTRELLGDLHARQNGLTHYPGDGRKSRAEDIAREVAHELAAALRTATENREAP